MKSSNTSLNGSTQLSLRFLGDLGVAPKDVDRLREQIDKTDQHALDGPGSVSWSHVKSAAQTIGVTLPTEMITKLFATKSAEAHVVRRVDSDYPVPSISRNGNDATIGIDSNKILLAENGDAKISKKAMLEWLYLRRTKSEPTQRAGFELHGFKTDKIAIDVPPGGTWMIVDMHGNQRGYGLKPVELTHSMFGENVPFTVKVLNKSREVVLEQTLAFGSGMMNRGSQSIVTGTFAKRAADDTNPERPRFSVGEEKDAERVVVKRDGKAFPIERYEQLLAPPRLTAQAFKAGGVTFMVRPRAGEAELDDPEYTWIKSAQIAASDGHAVTLDWSLKETRRAKWTAAGFEIYMPGSEKPFAVFDPFFGVA